jgi:hypothetical protein
LDEDKQKIEMRRKRDVGKKMDNEEGKRSKINNQRVRKTYRRIGYQGNND